MGTRYRRIGVIEDPELAAALSMTRDLLDESVGRSAASHVRRLALLGAQALAGRSPESLAARERQRILGRPGVRPATRLLSELPWLDAEPVDDQRLASQALEQVRGTR